MKIAIINRSFWPVYPVVGEALLRFAEKSALNGHSVCVISQDHVGLRDELRKSQRGLGIKFYPVKAFTTSASRIALRIFDSVLFMFWVITVLAWVRPNRVYISTDPPILVPFIVMLYSRLFGATYIYHLQDIHPEVTNVVVSMNKMVFFVLRKLDAITMRQADDLITITPEMSDEIQSRANVRAPIHLLDNPSVSFENTNAATSRKAGFSFCGNAGRLQRIPLLLSAISQYYESGGTLAFHFAGGGVYSDELRAFARRFENFHYSGLVDATEASRINAMYDWALLPIEDEVTRYAFPSKSSSYVFSGANILAICGKNTSVGKWVVENNLGIVVEPVIEKIVAVMFRIQSDSVELIQGDESRGNLKKILSFDYFVEQLGEIIYRV